MTRVGVSGGAKLQAYLENLQRRLESAETVKVGFLADATYPDGTSVAYIAAVQEFGGEANIPARQQDLHFKMNKAGEVGHRFVKAERSDFAQTVVIPAHTVTIPSRPFFRSMIDTKSKAWGSQSAKLLNATKFDAATALGQLGELIKSQLQASIRSLTDPPLAASTIRAKGFEKPLIDTGHMLNSVDYEVTT